MNLKEITKGKNAKFIDVRSYIEFKLGHIEGASNIPLDQLPSRFNEIQNLGKDPVVFYCRSGNRSEQALGFLRQRGFENIYNGGGIENLHALLKD